MSCAKEFSSSAVATVKAVADVANDDMILDIGPQTAAALAAQIRQAGTIVWNGPVGVFEFDQFGNGTKVLAEAIAESSGFSIAGGGDNFGSDCEIPNHRQSRLHLHRRRAFLEFLEGKTLPAVEILLQRAAS